LAEVNSLRRLAIEKHVGCKTLNPLEVQPEENTFDFVMDCVGACPDKKYSIKCCKTGWGDYACGAAGLG
jgi:alcohol dehydrogenase